MEVERGAARLAFHTVSRLMLMVTFCFLAWLRGL